MDLYTIDNVAGAPLGLVTGSTIKTKDIVKDIGAGLKGLVGGKLCPSRQSPVRPTA